MLKDWEKPDKKSVKYYRKHSKTRATSRFGYSDKEIAEIKNMILTGKYVEKLNVAGRTAYKILFDGETITVVLSNKEKEIVTFCYSDDTWELLQELGLEEEKYVKE